MSSIAKATLRRDFGMGMHLRGAALTLLCGLGWATAACNSAGSQPAARQDAAMPQPDSPARPDGAVGQRGPSAEDGGTADLALPSSDLAPSQTADLAMIPPDLARAVDLSVPSDLATASAQSVDIYVDNTCNMDVIPKSIDVPRGTSLRLTFHNRSRDYEVTVWMSYGGGYTDLATGGTWPDPIPHCTLPRPYNEYADISTACSKYRMPIRCL